MYPLLPYSLLPRRIARVHIFIMLHHRHLQILAPLCTLRHHSALLSISDDAQMQRTPS